MRKAKEKPGSARGGIKRSGEKTAEGGLLPSVAGERE